MNFLTDNPRRRSIIISIIYLAITVVFMNLVRSNMRMETDLDEYMPKSHPAFVYSNDAEERFHIKDGIIIAIENENGIYNQGTLQKIKDLSRKLGKMDEIAKTAVTSLYTADNIIGTEEGMDVKSFFRKVPATKAALEQLRLKVRSNEMVFGRLVSRDEKVSVIIAEIEDNVFSQKFYQDILDLTKSFEGPEKIHVAGTPIVEGTLAKLGPRDMKKMVPIVLLIIVIVLLAVTRSIRNSIFTLLVVILSTIWTFGIMAIFKVPIYSITTMVPIMLIAIGVADGIHLYSHLDLYLLKHRQATRKEAVADMLKSMWKPVVMTSVTTSVGFISLLTSEVFPIKYFGLFTAFGVMAACLFSLTLIPAGILLFGFPKRKQKINKKVDNQPLTAHNFADRIIKYRSVTLILTIIIVALSLFGMSRVWINSSFLDKFGDNSEIVLTDTFINEHFGGTSSLNVIIEGEKKDIIKQPETLRLMDDLQKAAESKPKIGASFSLADYLKRMNKVMHADEEAYNTVPESADLVAQYLLLYEMSGDPDNLWKVTDYNYQQANLILQLKSDNSTVIKDAIAVVESFREKFAEHGLNIRFAGSGYKALIFTDLILQGQIKSLIMSVIIIILLLTLMFRKLVVGLIGSVPIILTALIGFGVMGLLNIPLSSTTALISSIAVGIGIDYAVHFIERYRINAAETSDKKKAMQETMHHSGRAIIFNAMVVIAGFLVLLLSVFPPNRELGSLVSLNMFTSFLGTITIMSLLLYRFNIFFKKGK